MSVILVNFTGENEIMAACTFFGHRECPVEIKAILKSTLEDLIVNHGVDTFYVGNQGQFDLFARGVLQELIKKSPYSLCCGAGLYAAEAKCV